MTQNLGIWPCRTTKLNRLATQDDAVQIRQYFDQTSRLEVDDHTFFIDFDRETPSYIVDNNTHVVAIVNIGKGTYPMGYQLHLVVCLTNVDLERYGESELALAVIPLKPNTGLGSDGGMSTMPMRPDEAAILIEKIRDDLLAIKGMRGYPHN
jgi:hypothetical protein